MRQRAANTLRSLLRECYPAALEAFGENLTGRDALAVLTAAPDPATGRRLTPTRVTGLLSKAGRQPNLDKQAQQIVAALRSDQLPVHAELAAVHAASVSALVAVITTMVAQTGVLEEQVRLGFGRRPDAEIYLSQPGLGTILAARVLAEMGDDPSRYADARAQKNYAGMAPITRASGLKRVVLDATPGTGSSPTPSTIKRSASSPAHRAPAPATTGTAPAAPPTTKHSGPSLTGSSASSTAAYATTSPTTRPPPGPAKPPKPPSPLDDLQPWDVSCGARQ